jgi:hypothetical protein
MSQLFQAIDDLYTKHAPRVALRTDPSRIGIAFSYEGDYICGAWEDNKAAFQIHIDRLLLLR